VSIEQTQRNTLAATCYAALGQTVDYHGSVAGDVSIVALVYDSDSDFPGAFEVQAADADAYARIQIADLASPREGDTLTTVGGTVYTVDSYRRLNDTEWRLEVRRG
jgi:hypothetical protein